MCVIAVSPRGTRQPTMAQLRTMWAHNPHGAGYMVARDGEVTIHKGFMRWEDFEKAIKTEHFTAKDPVVYHFRISTQGGVNPEMTHPFPLSRNNLTGLDVKCPIGLAHNGVIPLTTLHGSVYSDTALFIANYMPLLIRSSADIFDAHVRDLIRETTRSRWAIMDGEGHIAIVGSFIDEKGLLFSNSSYQRRA